MCSGRRRKSLPAALLAAQALRGVVAAVPVDAGRIKVNGVFVTVLGVEPDDVPRRSPPSRPRASAALWHNVAAGGMAVSYTMGKQDKLPLGKPVKVAGARPLTCRSPGSAPSASAASTPWCPTGRPHARLARRDNAIVISAPAGQARPPGRQDQEARCRAARRSTPLVHPGASAAPPR